MPGKLKDDKKASNRKDTNSFKDEGVPTANFPVFMKLVVVLLVFGIIPFVVTMLIVFWSFMSTFREVVEHPEILPADRVTLEVAMREAEHTLRIRLGFLFILFSSCLVVGIWISSRLIVNPMTRFLQDIKKLSQGKLDTRINITTSDEFAIFGEYFNRMAERIEHARKREKWISETKSQLLGLAAHQLRTPLTAIQWIFHGLKNEDYGALNDGQKKVVNDGMVSTRRMIRLIYSLLNVTSIEEGKFGFEFKKVDLVGLMNKIMDDMEPLAKSKSVNLTFDSKDLESVEISADKDKLGLAIENIISNGVQYTPYQGSVDVSLKRKGRGSVQITVKDTGIGLTENDKKKLFTRFYRSGRGTAMNIEGAGLGLYIAKNIVESHGGEINIESKVNEGTTATIDLPIRKRNKRKDSSADLFFVE